MKDIQFILITVLVLSPILFFLYAIDGRIRPLLKHIRHILLYVLAAEIVIMLYILFSAFVFEALHVSNFISMTLYGDYFMTLGFAIITGLVTIIWWTVYFVSLAVKKIKQ
ncbi:MAG TPA: hypothetical protein VN698_02275 [Bacteroidia bacterium]|nr:hypothetical protein [Bacteroidia bacterium]